MRNKKPPTVWTKKDSRESWSWMMGQLRDGIRPELSRMSLVEWAETRRVIPQGLSPMPGLFSWSVTPYLEEIADNLSETSTVQETYVLKGAQVGYSVGIGENWILYTIDQAPGPMVYVAQSQGAAERTMRKRIRPAIQQSGIGHKVASQSKKPGSRGTGDTDELMEFPGGSLTAIGPAVGERLRSDSMQKGYLDEIDAWAQEVGTVGGKRKSEGSTLGNIMRRFDAYTNTYKVLGGSTPLEASSSIIEPLYLDGDQRQYNVPCKHCGALQPLEWERIVYDRWATVETPDGSRQKMPLKEAERGAMDEKWLVIDREGNLIPESVHYECRECGGHWKNDDKVFFLKNERQGGKAKWMPTAEPKVPNRRSYHLPSLYSPIGFRSWESIALESTLIGRDPTKLQQFWNTVLGRTWTPTGFTPDYTRIMIRRDGDPWAHEPLGTWPDGAYLCTLGADTQDDRLECEVVAWGNHGESWSLGYWVFPGDTANLDDPCWANLADLMDAEFGGHKIAFGLIDSQGHRTTEVYTFTERFLADRGQLMPCSGDAARAGKRLFGLFKVAGFSVRRADLQVDQLKAELYTNLNKTITENALIPRGYCHFPVEYGEQHFKGLMSEERIKERLRNGGSRTVWKPIKGRGRNERLDCRVYSMGALYVFKHLVLEESEELELSWDDFWIWAGSALA